MPRRHQALAAWKGPSSQDQPAQPVRLQKIRSDVSHTSYAALGKGRRLEVPELLLSLGRNAGGTLLPGHWHTQAHLLHAPAPSGRIPAVSDLTLFVKKATQ